MGKKTEWKQLGYLNKTKRADMLRGKIFIDELDISFDVVAFVKNEGAKKKGDADIRILLPIETEELF
jgi:hypothetical protein